MSHTIEIAVAINGAVVAVVAGVDVRMLNFMTIMLMMLLLVLLLLLMYLKLYSLLTSKFFFRIDRHSDWNRHTLCVES